MTFEEWIADEMDRNLSQLEVDQMRAAWDAATKNDNMKYLLAEILPDMEARVAGMREAWPGREVLTALHRNERFVAEIKRLTGLLTPTRCD